MNPKVDHYLAEGCGRCSLGGTPECKVHTWTKELSLLRKLMQSFKLEEEVKWGIPCYTFNKKNVLSIAAFKESCTLTFFKGALLKDPEKILTRPGENSNSFKLVRFTDTDEISRLEPLLKAYISEAIEVERQGLKVPVKDISEYEVPEELQAKFEELPELETAFKALTPGRQRAYLIHFSQAKQPATRFSRIEKFREKIMEGKGMGE